jgi:hypothetical protein
MSYELRHQKEGRADEQSRPDASLHADGARRPDLGRVRKKGSEGERLLDARLSVRRDFEVERRRERVLSGILQRRRECADARRLHRFVEASPQLARGKAGRRSIDRVRDQERLEKEGDGSSDQHERRHPVLAEGRVDPGSRGLVELHDSRPSIGGHERRASLRGAKENPAVERAL